MSMDSLLNMNFWCGDVWPCILVCIHTFNVCNYIVALAEIWYWGSLEVVG